MSTGEYLFMSTCLPWQIELWQRVMASRNRGRMPHAILLTGVQGIGKRYFAQMLVRSLLCRLPSASGLACGQCRDCRLLSIGYHPALFDCQPSETNAVIKIDQIRELAEFCTHTSSNNGIRIGLIAPAEQMNQQAANALLKTLEEPPPGVVLLLLSSQPRQLLATLRSRCQMLKLTRPPQALALQWLLDQGFTENTEVLLALAGGAPLQAQQLAQQQALSNQRLLFEIYLAVIEQRLSEVAAAEQWLRQDINQSLVWLLGWHMDLARLKLGEQTELNHLDLTQELRNLADVVSVAECFRRYHALLQIRQQLKIQRNAPMLMEAFFSSCRTKPRRLT